MSKDISEIQTKTLMLCPSVGVWQVGHELYFDRKFYDGVLAYAKHWLGLLRLIIRLENTKPPQFGLVQFSESSFPAKVVVIGCDEVIDSSHVDDVDIILASGDSFIDLNLAALCRQRKVKCIYAIEYILETRLQIIAINDLSYWRKLKPIVWLLLMERKRLQAFRLSDGLQTNGTPAYDAYASLVPNSLLYFDTRCTLSMCITDIELDARLVYLDKQAPLRLGFSGRLIRMKGADHLIEIAYQLHKRQVPFSLDIFGDGDLYSDMQEKIDKLGLSAQVRLRGAIDFASELVPFTKSELDLFVCCHRQSDPSCTYMETYACGVPIIGYNNRAHEGMLKCQDVGWSVKMNDVEDLVDKIVWLNSHRNEIKSKAFNAANFAREHTFESTFQRRISQCIQILFQ